MSARTAPARTLLATALTMLLALTVAACSGSAQAGELSDTATTATATATGSATEATQDTSRPNIVFVLTDDLSMNLLPYLPTVQRMQDEGTAFAQNFTTDSLCCPSRASIFTGRYPHSTGIYRNSGPQGGFKTFMKKGLDSDTFGTDLQAAGYKTAMMGKLLNQYEPDGQTPAGWDEWALAGMAYKQYDYTLNQNGTTVKYGSDPEDYMTDVIGARGRDFVARKAAANEPFMLEVATFTPHKPYPVAPRHQGLFKNLKAPRTAAYDTMPSPAPAWMAKHQLTRAEIKRMDRDFRKRVQGVQAVDDLVRGLWEQIRASGIEDNTYLVFSSDNGYHMGEYALLSGKMTAYDTDVHVPLVVVGPDVAKHRTVNALTSNIDLRATFGEIAGQPTPEISDGQSLAALWSTTKKSSPVTDRDLVLIEHRGPDLIVGGDPDYEGFRSANPPGYDALRSRDFLYIEYLHGETEYYDLRTDPDELHNIAGTLSKKRLAGLSAKLHEVATCTGHVQCAKAQQL
ncbi:sulfatase [Kineosporia sp. J2-2]|uniref:Sulfatase n=1 Tax=Kineosporia corallincola TaxID=2835133 RepID=A0ABS5TJB7_9ACTN|nr:sulfatase [Kineosporia corallincola]MBT0770158.1 sulfatase [Kineosporia corallincola]